jgi:diguanylate cyclase (GGDEF)-like protein
MRRFLLLSAAYFAGAWYAAALIGTEAEITLIWAPAGIAFAAALRYGPHWSLIAVAPVLLMHLILAPVPPVFLPFSVLSNVLGAIAGQYACARWKDLKNPLSMRSGFSILSGGMAMSLTSSLIGCTGLIVAKMLDGNDFWPAYAKWALGDLLGIITFGPIALYLTDPAVRSRIRRRPAALYAPRREKAIWLLCLLVSFLTIYLVGIQSSPYAYGLVALPLSVLLWSAIRFEPIWSILGMAITVLTLTSLTGLGMAGFPAPHDRLEAAILLGSMCVFANVPITLMAAMAQQRAANLRALRQATVDEATGLPNRAAFESAMKTAQSQTNRDQGLAYLDLDHLSVINDTAGHAAGDAMLHGVGSLLRAEVGTDGEVFRIGGDEFALLIDGDAAQVRARIEHVRQAIELYRVGWHGRVLNATASIGVVPFRSGETGRIDLLSLADTACFTAKELGGNRVCLANEERGGAQDRTEAMRWAVRIREALDRGLFELHCQSISPFVGDDPGGRHIEILLRMRDPASGQLLTPGQFIPAAERFQLGVALDRHVIELALHWFESRPETAESISVCAINLTAASMVDESFREFLIARIHRSTLPARKLCFEITETSAVRDLSRAQELIIELRALGCAFALDDFGTGFCSFDYLRSLDVDYLKIDGSFIRNLADSALSAAVAHAIADIARVLDKKTIAEQVETDAVLQTLRTLGIDYAQGYFLHRPEPLADYFLATST